MGTWHTLAGDPDAAEPHLGRGRKQAGDETRAEQGLRRVLELEHFQPLAHLSLAALLMRQGRFWEAVSRLETALAQDERLQGAPDLLDQARAGLGHGIAATAMAGSVPGRD